MKKTKKTTVVTDWGLVLFWVKHDAMVNNVREGKLPVLYRINKLMDKDAIHTRVALDELNKNCFIRPLPLSEFVFKFTQAWHDANDKSGKYKQPWA